MLDEKPRKKHNFIRFIKFLKKVKIQAILVEHTYNVKRRYWRLQKEISSIFFCTIFRSSIFDNTIIFMTFATWSIKEFFLAVT